MALTWQELYELNKDTSLYPNGKPFSNPNLIYPGQVLELPDGSQYEVVSGDTLSGITQRYNNGTLNTSPGNVTSAPDPVPEETATEPPPEPPPPPTLEEGPPPYLKRQATLQSRYKQQGNSDWRVRLTLAESADYLWATQDSGILKPLAATQGVIFPYLPQITTNYSANYDQYDLTHSNYRGVFYKNSRVGDIQIRGTFTAQDTKEAAYLLAVIHFFRSVTKMFYGQDANRGTPPPLVYLYGLGSYQFNQHPCLISTFNYTLPNDVDYIRATAPNNYGDDMLNRRWGSQSAPGGSAWAGARRLYNAALSLGALVDSLTGDTTTQSVNNTEVATYVPTKMEIDLTLIPVQTRSQVSNQFSLKKFARGDQIKGGFW